MIPISFPFQSLRKEGGVQSAEESRVLLLRFGGGRPSLECIVEAEDDESMNSQTLLWNRVLRP
jgi:hypothetical protein